MVAVSLKKFFFKQKTAYEIYDRLVGSEMCIRDRVRMDGEKMSKSLGNLVFVSDLRQKHDPRAIRLALINHHYRNSWSWTPDLMEMADQRLRSWVNAGSGDGGLEQVRNCLDDDLNTPEAIRVLDAQAAAGNGVSEAAKLLGVNIDRL